MSGCPHSDGAVRRRRHYLWHGGGVVALLHAAGKLVMMAARFDPGG